MHASMDECVQFMVYSVRQQKLEKLRRTFFHTNTICSSTSNGFKMLLSDFLFRLFSTLSLSITHSLTHSLRFSFSSECMLNATKTKRGLMLYSNEREL